MHPTRDSDGIRGSRGQLSRAYRASERRPWSWCPGSGQQHVRPLVARQLVEVDRAWPGEEG
eukprot:2875585-Prymnesium_polylepis.1